MPREGWAAPDPWVASCAEDSSPTPQPTDELLNLGPSWTPFPRPSLLHGGEVEPGASAGVTPTPYHCRWTDGSIINFISWAPGKPRPIGKDKKCVYMTASRGEGEMGQRGCGSRGEGHEGAARRPWAKAISLFLFFWFPQLKKGQTREGRAGPQGPTAMEDLSSELESGT